MDDPDTHQLAEEIERLQGEIERLEERQKSGRNTLEMRSHDLSVKATSEDADLEKIAHILSGELQEMSRRAMIGEYETLEREDLFSEFFK